MRIVPSTTLAASLFLAGTTLALAEEKQMTTADILDTDQGVLFVNNLGTPIVDAFARPREQCDLYLCDEWRQLDREGWSLSSGKAAAMGLIFSTPDGQPRACKWALKVATEDGMAYEFDAFDVCVPDLRNQISFRKDSDGEVTAVHGWRDEKGEAQTTTVAAK